ncbi:hypothetical protein C8N40_10635 [Pontibacter mucosus]|uniref:Uncharacterized protein n=1 Tax=Pontibacter mucosus TaxID=1649266 RepID=A0A2T5YG18_9BACT|nr:hypothetical protein C8N40_10635 [Pontibacter mucosus]
MYFITYNVVVLFQVYGLKEAGKHFFDKLDMNSKNNGRSPWVECIATQGLHWTTDTASNRERASSIGCERYACFLAAATALLFARFLYLLT